MLEFDNFKSCRVCGVPLSDIELNTIKSKKIPAVCEFHEKQLQEKLKKCLPLFQKMKLS